MVDGDSGEAVLDLSTWPAQPLPPPQRRPALPPRPVRRRRLPAVGLGRLGAGALALGALLLAVPLPGTGCPSALSVWTTSPAPLPAATPPDLDDALVAADRTAVAGAQAALAAHDAQVAAARKVLARPPSSPATTHPAGASGDVAALRAAVTRDAADRDRAQAARDRLVEEQQTADDPSAYDSDVAAAQEDLDVAEARLADDQQALAAAQRPASSPAPVAAAPSGRDEAQAVVDQDAALRATLVLGLGRAQQAQAQHLAQRRDQLAAWAARHAREAEQVRAANGRLAACGRTVAPTGTAGALLGAVGAGLLVLRRFRR